MSEDKQAICNALLLALKKTKDLYDLVELNYIKGDGDEIVVAKFQNGHEKKVCVNMDSGIAMILDIAIRLF